MYLEIDEGFYAHRKTIRLGKLTGTPAACGFPIRLWSWACRSCRDGDLSGMTPEEIDEILGAPVYAHMVASGFIDEIDGKPSSIHGWMDHTGAAIVEMERRADELRARDRERQRRHRHGGVTHESRVTERDSTVTSQAVTPPVQSSPDQTRQREGEAPAVPEPSPDAPAPITPVSEARDANGWLRVFGAAWADAKRVLAYGGGSADARAVSELRDTLARLPDADVVDALDKRRAMIAAFLRDDDPRTVAAGHKFSFFVARFDALRTARGSPARPTTSVAARLDAAAARRQAECARNKS